MTCAACGLPVGPTDCLPINPQASGREMYFLDAEGLPQLPGGTMTVTWDYVHCDPHRCGNPARRASLLVVRT
jgi:hypothetical protein